MSAVVTRRPKPLAASALPSAQELFTPRHCRSCVVLRALVPWLALVVLGIVAGPACAAPPTPNILFILMDDVGIDQMKLFGYGGETPPSTPTIDTIANAGVRFSNTWSMPACSASRSVIFTGRFPLRTNVYTALGNADLANSQVSPFEMTVPKLLKQRGYNSALFGKFHLGIQTNNPFRYAMPRSLGWDYYSGWLDETGDPSSIDTTAGGVAPKGTWSCGFVPGSVDGGADRGACYAAGGGCRLMKTSGGIPPGRACRDGGGIFDPDQKCSTPRPANLNFTTLSAHYVSPLVINYEDGRVEQVPSTDIRARTYRGTVPVDAAIEWIQRQPKDQPWMATVSFASTHTPVMQPPPGLLASGAATTSGLDCANAADQRILTNQMIEALDAEVARLLVAIGLAHRGHDGNLTYRPQATDTMVIAVTDNGSFGGAVKSPFDPNRSKSTVYQTGVWVPLVVAGPLVKQPDREVAHMVNTADLYQLFGEIAGIDVPQSVPRTIDSVALLPYLVDPRQGSIRTWNFTQVSPNLQANGGINAPCVFNGTSCSQITPTQGVCTDNGGVWWGQGATDPATAGIPAEGLKMCCDVNVWQASKGQPTYSILPTSQVAIRNDRYKLVNNSFQGYDAGTNACVPVQSAEFYEIDEAVPIPKLDREDSDLIAQGPLSFRQQVNYNALTAQLQTLLASQPACPGDGNIDGVVNEDDLGNWDAYRALAQGTSSWYDFNLDGLTDESDLATIQQNLGTQCTN
jgi:hypothetical protein